MNNNFNPYSILGVNLNCSLDDIKKAYKFLAKKYHPDRHGDSNKFMKIQIAYEMLTDNQQLPHSEHTELKKQYSEFINDNNRSSTSQQTQQTQQTP